MSCLARFLKMANPEHELALYRASKGATSSTDLSNFDLSYARFTSAKLAEVVLRYANMRQADGSGAYLRNADLSHANLEKARLLLADLRNVKFISANLKSADLSSAFLQDADFSGANLSNCRLTKSHLAKANFNNATLTKTDFRGARELTPDQIRLAKDWKHAIFDQEMAHALGIIQEIETARFGAKKSKRSITNGETFKIDIIFSLIRPTFGDLYRICGGDHPNFPPSGACDLSTLAPLGFEQTDDYFAICRDNHPVIWLYPLIRNVAVYHNVGPFDGVRIELTRKTKPLQKMLLDVVSGFVNAVPVELRQREEGKSPGSVIAFASLREQLIDPE